MSRRGRDCSEVGISLLPDASSLPELYIERLSLSLSFALEEEIRSCCCLEEKLDYADHLVVGLLDSFEVLLVEEYILHAPYFLEIFKIMVIVESGTRHGLVFFCSV